MSTVRPAFVCLLAIAFFAVPAAFAESKPHPYSPYADRDYPTEVFWGDTHLHTSSSMDAGAFGNRLDADAAYRFARGATISTAS